MKLVLAHSCPCHLAPLSTWRQCQAVGSWVSALPSFCYSLTMCKRQWQVSASWLVEKGEEITLLYDFPKWE